MEHHPSPQKKQSFFRIHLVVPILIVLFIVLGTIIAVLYGRGYRFGFTNGQTSFSLTGILAVSSTPDGAEVFINDHLTTATNNSNLTLTPGEYTIKINKEGYLPWQKKITIEKEVVNKLDAFLIPAAPKLEALTTTGVSNPVLDPSQSRIAYTVASQSARKNGIYVLTMNTRPVLALQGAATQLADDTANQFSQSTLEWSPDGQQIIASVPNGTGSNLYLLTTSGLNNEPQDITLTVDTIKAQWAKEQTQRDKARLSSLKKPLQKMIADDFTIISWSPDDTKILYTASNSATLPEIIKPPLIGANQTPQSRTLEEGSVYVYDIKEDKNFKIHDGPIAPTPTPTPEPEPGIEQPAQIHPVQLPPPLEWFADSEHLIYTHDKKIDLMEYDGQNRTTVFAGPFMDSYAFSWPDSTKIVMLTDLGNTDVPPNLYTIDFE